MEYNKSYESYMNYVNKCRNIIMGTSFTEEDAINLDLSPDGLDVCNEVREHRLKMIDIKLDHTMRMIDQVIRISDKLGFQEELCLVTKLAVLYHDIGRIRQSIWCNTFNDSIYKRMNRPYNNHGEEGYDIFLNNDFNIDKKYIPLISMVILHHQDYHMHSKLNYKFENNLNSIKIEDIITGNFEFNDDEWQIASLIVQLVADIDKVDILYQHLSSDFEMIRDYIYDSSMDTLENIAYKWGISKEEILEYNKIDEVSYQPRRIRIPIKNVSLDKLEIPQYMKDMFYNNSWLELNILMKDENWNFISMLWWRLSYFLNQIVFTATLINIYEYNLLDQIYEKIPERLRPLVDEAFEYAKCELVVKRIEKNKGNVYLKK